MVRARALSWPLIGQQAELHSFGPGGNVVWLGSEANRSVQRVDPFHMPEYGVVVHPLTKMLMMRSLIHASM